MSVFGYTFLFILGLMTGSFLNVVIYRMNSGIPFWKGRSICMSCGKSLKWYELIPVLSFIFLKRKCSECGSVISWQYPLVEFTSGILFVFSFYFYGFGAEAVFNLVLFLLLLIVFVYDMRHLIIDDKLILAIAIVALLKILLIDFGVVINFNETFMNIVNSLIVSSIIPFGLFWLLWKLSDGKWIGLGDAKLVLVLGLFAKGFSGIEYILIAFWIGGIWGIALYLTKLLKGGNLSDLKGAEIPFAPFLILGFILVYVFGIQMGDIILSVSGVF